MNPQPGEIRDLPRLIAAIRAASPVRLAQMLDAARASAADPRKMLPSVRIALVNSARRKGVTFEYARAAAAVLLPYVQAEHDRRAGGNPVVGRLGHHRDRPERLALIRPDGSVSNWFAQDQTRGEIECLLADAGLVLRDDDSVAGPT